MKGLTFRESIKTFYYNIFCTNMAFFNDVGLMIQLISMQFKYVLIVLLYSIDLKRTI